MDNKKIVSTLKEWTTEVQKTISVKDIYLFGSSIINDGFLFDVSKSDIDLVILIPDDVATASERTEWLCTLEDHKSNLELAFVKLFKRTGNIKPIVSLLPITRHELFADIHKSSVRDFFRDNEFYSVLSDKRLNGLVKNSDIIVTDDIVRQLIEFSQGVRNKYFAFTFVSKDRSLDWQSDDEVAPKEIMRTSALAAYVENKKQKREEKTDLKIGFSHLQYYVYSRRHDNALYLKTYNWIGKRLLRKGELPILTSADYLFISEMIFDMALSLYSTKDLEKTIKKYNNNNESVLDITKAIDVNIFVAENAHLKGVEDEIHKEIINAGVNITWRTEPFFEINLEEMSLIEQKIKLNPKDGKSLDRLRKLIVLKNDLVEGFKYIIYYQNLLFYDSKNILDDILIALRRYTIIRYVNVLENKNAKGLDEGFLQAYIYDHSDLSSRFPNVSIKAVLNFGLPEAELNTYLQSNEALNSEYPSVNLMSLAASNQPLLSLNTSLLAYFFVPLLVQRLVESKIDPLSTDKEISKFNREFTDLDAWSFGVK